MTTELEKQFFETFEIPKIYKTTINIGDLDVNLKEIQAPTLKELYEIAQYDFTTPIYFSWFKRSKRWSEVYPQITDRIWLELVRIYASHNIFLLRKNMEDFKYDILTALIERPYEYRKQIRELFKGE